MSTSSEPILKEHKLLFPPACQHNDENSWVFSAICNDCQKTIHMKFHGEDVRKMGRASFMAMWERACRLTIETTICEREKSHESDEEDRNDMR
jgi:hypothetical protein